MTERSDILANHPLVSFMEGRGAVMRGSGKSLTTNRCAQQEHKAGHLCVNVDAERQIWYCNDCQIGGSVIDFIAIADGITPVDAIKRLSATDTPFSSKKPVAVTQRATATVPAKMVKAYDYTDEAGKLLFQVCRFEPKDFRQRAPDGQGGWIYKLEGIRRTLYNLPKVLAADFIFICEGEKDADSLNAASWVATTNCGGAKKWSEEYSASLRGKDVAILPDNDAKGKEHCEQLKKELAPVVASIRVIEMPHGIKDVTEFFQSFADAKEGPRQLLEMLSAAEILYRGESVPIQTMDEMEKDYTNHIQRAKTQELNLGKWLPSFGRYIRPLVPGELFTILAGTGCGKTMILQNIAINTRLVTLMIEAELPSTLSFERFAAMATSQTGHAIESTYKAGGEAEWRQGGRLNHIVCCHKSGLTPERIARIIETTHLKTSVRPVLVLIDYIQLIGGDGDSRYERTSCTAEKFKQVAKDTNTIIVMASQIGRASTPRDGKKKTVEVSLTDGKDSGSIENSSGLVVGAWRDEADADRMWLRILKNTKGIAGKTIPTRINSSLLITEEIENEPT